jgi:hypothetical protein
MIRAVLRGIALCLLVASLCFGQAADEAVRSLASKLLARLPPSTSVRVTVRNVSSASDAEAAAMRTSLERALRRTGRPVDVGLTVSQNIREFLLIAEFDHDGEQAFEIVSFQPDPVVQTARPVVEKRLLLEQRNPILDAAVFQDRLFVLEPDRLSVYDRRGASWQLAGSKDFDAVQAVRDLRARLEITNDAITAIFPGRVCLGANAPALDIHCEPGDASFAIAGEKARFTAGRNTIEAAGFPASFSLARTADGLFLAAEPDGRGRQYDGSKRAAGVIDGWGSDLGSPEPGCVVLVTSAADGDSADSITALRFVDGKPSQVGAPAEFEGGITALWTKGDGTVAVVHNPKAGTYAAYLITVDCAP